MKLVTYSLNDQPQLGAVIDDTVYPLNLPAAADMCALAANWEGLRAAAEKALESRGRGHALSEVTLLPPVTRPGKMMAIGLNYADHIRESKLASPVDQTWFCKQLSALNGPYADVEVPKVSDAVDYEAELVVIIGRGGRHISREDAPKHVFGYCVGNDVSVRDWQLSTTQWVVGKSFDTHAPIGPWITTADAIGDPHRLGIRCLVNGEERQNSNTKELVFDVWAQIEHISKAMTLYPGDILFTGTPGGVGFASNPPRKLKDGDVVRVEIDELGHIENRFRNEA